MRKMFVVLAAMLVAGCGHSVDVASPSVAAAQESAPTLVEVTAPEGWSLESQVPKPSLGRRVDEVVVMPTVRFGRDQG